MWGNTTGWIIAAVIGLGMGSLLLMVALPPTPTPPTNNPAFAVANKAIQLPVPADTVVADGTNNSDAGDLYRKAISDFASTKKVYDVYRSDVNKNKGMVLPAIDDILKARDFKQCTLFRKDPSVLVNYENNHPTLETLRDAGLTCVAVGILNAEHLKPPKPDQAIKLWEAAFILGERMYDERVSWDELVKGHELMQASGGKLLAFYTAKKDTTRANTIKNFIDEEDAYARTLTKAFEYIGAVDETYAGPYAGDVFKVATNPSADPMFRVEALKHVGHYRYNAKTMGDQRLVRKVLGKLANEPNLPASVKEAVKAAQDLTIEQHNMVGGSA
jgi:hypothetical protein